MERIRPDEVSAAAQTFAQAMVSDPLHAYFFPAAADRLRRLLALYAFRVGSRPEGVFKTSDGLEGVALWEGPGEHDRGLLLRDLWRGLGLAWEAGPRAIRRMAQYDAWAGRIRRGLIADPYWYLETLAVGPAHQGQGFASRLVRPVLEEAALRGHRVYLETQNDANVALYQRYGFALASIVRVPGTRLVHHAMVWR